MDYVLEMQFWFKVIDDKVCGSDGIVIVHHCFFVVQMYPRCPQDLCQSRVRNRGMSSKRMKCYRMVSLGRLIQTRGVELCAIFLPDGDAVQKQDVKFRLCVCIRAIVIRFFNARQKTEVYQFFLQ